MKHILFALLFLSLFAACGDSSDNGGSSSAGVTVGYQGVAAFDDLTSEDYTNVRALKVFFQHASVGQNTVNGLTAINNSDAKYGLSLYSGTDSQIISEFTSGNTHFADCFQNNDGWKTKMDNFKTRMDGGVADVSDICMMKLCYIDSWADSLPNVGYAAKFEAYRDMMLYVEAKYPSVTFIWWTMPICTSGDAERDGFNTLVRNYAAAHGKWLFDIASVESHDPSGTALSDATGEILCSDYNSGDGGHPNTASGELRIGKALFVLLSDIAKARGQ